MYHSTGWTNVSTKLKEQIWESISGTYQIQKWHKDWVIKKANLCWKEWKSNLRRNVYDKYPTDAERKKHVPHYVRKEDWERFVDFNSTPEGQALRATGKRVRQENKNTHTSGRKGQARLADELSKEDPHKEITRTDIYIASHAKSQQTEAINRMIANDPSNKHNDLDHDPVAVVCGPDSRGRVRGMGSGVSKTSVRASIPYKQALAYETTILHNRVDKLTEVVQKMNETLQQSNFSTRTPMRSSTNLGSFSQVRPDSPHHESHSNPPSIQTGPCKVNRLQRPHDCVAEGRVIGASNADSDSYDILIDEVLDGNVILQSGEGTFADLTCGDIIDWPKFRIKFY